MKQFILSIALIGISACLFAQPDPINKEKMKPFQLWVGTWKGESQFTNAQGQSMKSSVEENIQSKVEGTVLLIEGIGKIVNATGEERIVHHAMGVLAYDQYSNAYRFKTYVQTGHSTDAWFKIISENNFQWGFESPNARFRYNIILDPIKKTWFETGEFSNDGNTWKKTIEMNLKKVE